MLLLGAVIVACLFVIVYILMKTQGHSTVQSAFTDQVNVPRDSEGVPAVKP